MTQRWVNSKSKDLFRAILELKTSDEVAKFLRDLLTEPEIEEFASRWEIAKLLAKGESQRDIATKTGASVTTVTRVNQWLKRGTGGYQLVIDRLKTSKSSKHPRLRDILKLR